MRGVLLAYDPKRRDEVVLIEQIRIPAYPETSQTHLVIRSDCRHGGRRRKP